jgi:hypothetical protein
VRVKAQILGTVGGAWLLEPQRGVNLCHLALDAQPYPDPLSILAFIVCRQSVGCLQPCLRVSERTFLQQFRGLLSVAHLYKESV